jgi:hypothetical protein
MTKEKVLGLLTLLFAILKPFVVRWWNKWAAETPAVEKCLIWVTRGVYHKNQRAKKAREDKLIQEREEETKRLLDQETRTGVIEELLAEIGIRNGFHRVTLSKLTYTGGFFPVNPILEDFEKINITIPYEWVARGIARIADEWQNRSGRRYAQIFYKLYYDPKGYISIGPTDSDDLTMLMNMHHVIWSMRFRMSKESSIFDGMVTTSIMFGDVPDEPTIAMMTKEVVILTNMLQELLTNN